jgi:hypothetical protein
MPKVQSVAATAFSKMAETSRRGVRLSGGGHAGISGRLTGLVVDVGHLHMKEAQAMRAADAAALAGAMQLVQEGNTKEAADKVAIEYARMNGYDPKQPNVTFTSRIDPENPNWYSVYLARPEPLFFMRVLPDVGSTKAVGATATAEFVAAVPVSITPGSGSYSKDGPANLSVFGPHAEYQWGDPYSTIWKDNQGTLNEDHLNFKGYNFELNVPADYSARNNNQSVVNVELFDPDTYNSNGSVSPNGTSEWDEIRQPYSGPGQQPTSIYTQTKFSLYKVNDPNDPSKDTLIRDAVYRDDPATNNKWVTPPGFAINTNLYGTGKFRINVSTLDGSSENGFDLRAGPPLADGEQYNKNNGATIAATDSIPINFNTTGLTTIELGQVPDAAAGRELVIQKFDTDVNSKSVVYTSIPPASNQPPGGWPGRLAGNAQWETDDPIKLPDDYKAATWYATYEAGWQDTSLWKMSFSAAVAGSPGHVRLVGRDNKPY